MAEKQITYRLVDTGHWLARCDHSTAVIEINRREFFKLSPMYQEYVWLHECVHLLYDIYDETECNRIADEIFISRAKDADDRVKRIKFIANSNDYGKSNSAGLVSLVCSAIGLITSASSTVISNRNSGYYSLNESERKTLVDSLLSEAFTASLLTDTQSAKDIFWANIQPNIPRKNEQTFTGWRKNNTFVDEYIEKYEQQWGFGFSDVTPVNEKAHPQYQKKMRIIGVSAMAVAMLVLVLILIKTKK